MKNKLSVWLYILAVSSLPEFNFAIAQEMVLGNVHVVDVESGKLLENRFLILKDGVIMQVMPMSKLPNSGLGMNITDGKGAFIYLGLAEMYAHLLAAKNENTQL